MATRPGSIPEAMKKYWNRFAPVQETLSDKGTLKVQGNGSTDWRLSSGWSKVRKTADWEEKPKASKRTIYDLNGNKHNVRYVKTNGKDIRGFAASNPDSDRAKQSNAYANYIFDQYKDDEDGKNVIEKDGCGHIAHLKYAVNENILQVTFQNGASCIYFKVPKYVAGTLLYYAETQLESSRYYESGPKFGESKHKLGIAFWNLIRIRGQHRKAMYPFEYSNLNVGKYTEKNNRHVVQATAKTIIAILGLQRFKQLVGMGYGIENLLEREYTVVCNDKELEAMSNELRNRFVEQEKEKAASYYLSSDDMTVRQKSIKELIEEGEQVKQDDQVIQNEDGSFDSDSFDDESGNEHLDTQDTQDEYTKRKAGSLENFEFGQEDKNIEDIINRLSGEKSHEEELAEQHEREKDTMMSDYKLMKDKLMIEIRKKIALARSTPYYKKELTGFKSKVTRSALADRKIFEGNNDLLNIMDLRGSGLKKNVSASKLAKALGGFDGTENSEALKMFKEYSEKYPTRATMFTAMSWRKSDLDFIHEHGIIQDNADALEFEDFLNAGNYKGALEGLKRYNIKIEYKSDGNKVTEKDRHIANENDYFLED